MGIIYENSLIKNITWIYRQVKIYSTEFKYKVELRKAQKTRYKGMREPLFGVFPFFFVVNELDLRLISLLF